MRRQAFSKVCAEPFMPCKAHPTSRTTTRTRSSTLSRLPATDGAVSNSDKRSSDMADVSASDSVPIRPPIYPISSEVMAPRQIPQGFDDGAAPQAARRSAHEVPELLEKVAAVMGAGRRFRAVLYAKERIAPVLHAFQRLVVAVDVRP